MFNTLCGKSRLRCVPPFLILKSMINFRHWSKEITCYKLDMNFSLSKHRMRGGAKPGMKLLNGFIEFPYKKTQITENEMNTAKQKTGYNFKINVSVHSISTEAAVSMS